MTGGRPGSLRGLRGPALDALIRAEYVKLRTARWALWPTVAAGLGCAALTWLAAGLYAAQWNGMTAAARSQLRAHAVGVLLQLASTSGQLVICVAGVLAVVGEYAAGMTQASFLIAPRRVPVLAARAVTFAGAGFTGGAAVAVAALGAGLPLIGLRAGLQVPAGAAVVAVAGFGLSLAVAAVLVLGIATLVRSAAAAVSTTLAVVVVAPLLAADLPGPVGGQLRDWLPAAIGTPGLPGGAHGLPGDTPGLPGGAHGAGLPPWQSLGVRCGWALAVLTLAAIRLRRRDANFYT